jgi:hypothetical protein
MSVGGMLGGIFNVLIAPHVFDSVLEYSDRDHHRGGPPAHARAAAADRPHARRDPPRDHLHRHHGVDARRFPASVVGRESECVGVRRAYAILI